MSSIQLDTQEHPPQLHVPVLLEKSLETIKPRRGESYLDLTAGYGGHAKAFLDITENYEETVLVDRDINAVKHLQPFEEKGVSVVHADFLTAADVLLKKGQKFDIVFVDLGVSSPQLDKEERGFSFAHDGPLDMRMDQRQALTAAKLVNTSTAKELYDIIINYGEERPAFARRIVQAVIKARPINTTKELSSLILNEHRGGWKKTHPATRTFQALRIATNQELRQVEGLLPKLTHLLNKNGRVGIISFHSLEDRPVKHFLKEQAQAGLEAEFSVITKKPIDGAVDDVHNPRSRSAKLRVAVKK